MREDFERLRAKLRKDRSDAAAATASGDNSDPSVAAPHLGESSSPASAAVASGLERKPTLVSVSSLSTPVKAPLSGHSALSPPSPTGTPHATPSAQANALSPSAITFANSPASTTEQSPSMLRRTISFSTTAHMLQSQYGINSTGSLNAQSSLDGSTGSHPTTPTSSHSLALPEHFVQLLLWNPVTRTPHLLSGDMEIGSVREVIWPKVKRQTSAANLAIPTPMDPKRSSGSFAGNKELLPSLESGNSNVNPRLMLVYYTRTPAAEDWLKHELRRHHSEAEQNKRGSDTERPTHHVPTDNLQRSASTSQLVTASAIHPPVSSRSVAPRIMPSVQTATNLRVAKPMPVPAQVSFPALSPSSSSSQVRTIRDPISSSGAVAYIPTSAVTSNGSGGAAPLSPLPVRTFTSTLPVSAPYRPASASKKRTDVSAPVVSTSSTGSRPSSAVRGAYTAATSSGVRPSSATQKPDANGKDRMAEDNVGVILSRHRP